MDRLKRFSDGSEDEDDRVSDGISNVFFFWTLAFWTHYDYIITYLGKRTILPQETSTWDHLEIHSMHSKMFNILHLLWLLLNDLICNFRAKPTDFDFLKVIGKGSFGKVFLAKRKHDEKYYAVKVLQKKVILNRKEQKHIMAERNVLLKNVKHPFLVGLHYSFQTADKLYFVLDFINGGELFFHLQKERTFPEPRARFYIAEMASALGYLHSINIVYRDLKPENILLDHEGHIVLTDFGLCKEGISQTDTTTTFCGTPEYLAPEVLKKQPYDNTVDWWCLGSVLYEMLYGLPPFYSRDTHEMYDNILHKPLPMRAGASHSAWLLLQGLLEKDNTLRLGCKDDFNEIKAHNFFSSINWDDLEHKKIPPPFTPKVVSLERERIFKCSLFSDDAFVGFSYHYCHLLLSLTLVFMEAL
uniref:Serine/threonine-protein kinase Sgk1 n=1 Tax=Neogobius melanostomus TaxID=47308 RepID=A0A8C6TLQ9_9GOBI